MNKISIYLVPLVMVVVAVMMLAGCAALQKNEVSDLEGQQNSNPMENNPIESNRPGVVTGEDWSQAPWGPFDKQTVGLLVPKA